MRAILVPLILGAMFAAGVASAQSVDPYARYGTAGAARGYGHQGYPLPDYGQGYDGGGYGAQGYGSAPPPPGGVSYRDDERYGAGERYGSADARADADLRGDGKDLRGARASRGRQNPRTRAYAARVARWRARADACEAGDIRACKQPF